MTDLIARLTSPMDAGNRAQPDSVVVHFDSVEQLAQYRAAIIHALKVQQAAEDACQEMTWAEFIGKKWPALVRAVKGEQG